MVPCHDSSQESFSVFSLLISFWPVSLSGDRVHGHDARAAFGVGNGPRVPGPDTVRRCHLDRLGQTPGGPHLMRVIPYGIWWRCRWCEHV